MPFPLSHQLHIQVITCIRYGIEDTILLDPSSSTGRNWDREVTELPKVTHLRLGPKPPDFQGISSHEHGQLHMADWETEEAGKLSLSY